MSQTTKVRDPIELMSWTKKNVSGEEPIYPVPEDGDARSPRSACDDAELLRLYAETRSEEAFAAFVERYVDLVHSAAERCAAGDVHLAKDITQEVFIAVAHRAATLAGHRALEGWLYTTTRYEANHAVRREQRRRIREEKAHMMQELHSDPTAEPDWQRLRPLIDDSMGQLNDRDREAVLMRFFLRRPFREISAKLGINEDAARHRVDRALHKLQKLLTRHGVTSTAAAVATMLSTQAVVAAPAGTAKAMTAVALASSGGAAATAFNVFTFMSTTKLTAGAVGVTFIIAAIGTGIYELNTRGRMEASLAAANRQVESSQRQVTDLENRAKAAADEHARLTNAVAATNAADNSGTKAVTALANVVSDQPSASIIAGDKFFAAHPEARKLWDDREKLLLGAKEAPMYRALSLTDEQIASLQDLQVQVQTRNTGISTPDGLMTLHAEPTLTQSEFVSRVRALLGDKADQVFAFAQMAPAYNLAAQLAGSVYRSEPLSSNQIDQVVQILANASPSRQAGEPINRSTVDWNAALTQAQAILSQGQLAAFAALQPQITYQQTMQRLSDPPSSRSPSATDH